MSSSAEGPYDIVQVVYDVRANRPYDIRAVSIGGSHMGWVDGVLSVGAIGWKERNLFKNKS